MDLSLSTITEGDLPVVDRIIRAAYFRETSYTERLRRHLALEPDGWKLVRVSGEIVGCGGSTTMGTVAYIGLVAVEPSFQRRGVATYLMRGLLEWSYNRGCTTILLDASEAGEPLYRRLGFLAEDLVGVWTASPAQVQAETPVQYAGLVETALPNVSAALAEADARWTLTPRQDIIQTFVADQPDRVLIAHRPEGDLEGYIILQPKICGPWLAASSQAAEALLLHGLGLAGDMAELSVFAPSGNLAATDILLRSGFRYSRSVTHMRLGIPLDPNRRQRIYGQINLALG